MPNIEACNCKFAYGPASILVFLILSYNSVPSELSMSELRSTKLPLTCIPNSPRQQTLPTPLDQILKPFSTNIPAAKLPSIQPSISVDEETRRNVGGTGLRTFSPIEL